MEMVVGSGDDEWRRWDKKVVMEGDGGGKRSWKKVKKSLLNKTEKNKKPKLKPLLKQKAISKWLPSKLHSQHFKTL